MKVIPIPTKLTVALRDLNGFPLMISALATMIALSLVCNAQAPIIVAEKLYVQYDQAWANHDLKQVLDFFDPSFAEVDTKGKRIEFEEFRKLQTNLFKNTNYRNFNPKSKIKDVQMKEGRMVVYYEAEVHFQYLDQKMGWEPQIQTVTGETTWQRRGDEWKIVMRHTLRQNTIIDPQWLAMKRQELQNRYDAIQRAADSVLRPCTNSYNGC